MGEAWLKEAKSLQVATSRGVGKGPPLQMWVKFDGRYNRSVIQATAGVPGS